MSNLELSTVIDAVRKFNRFYTKILGVLNESLLESRYSLAEARVLYELANRDESTATGIGSDLNLLKSYLSQILKRLDEAGLLEKSPSERDSRQTMLSLSAKGREEVSRLDEMSRQQIESLVSNITTAGHHKLLESMAAIETMFGEYRETRDRIVEIRETRPGDMGWVVQCNGRVYADEYGWDATYEALVAQIVADFIKNFDFERENCWIAEENGENIGSVFLVKESDEIARLRLLIVDPKARGLGLGTGLVERCTAFARRTGYKKITLWTQSNLLAARTIYANAGYKCINSEPSHRFGKDLVSETWELKL